MTLDHELPFGSGPTIIRLLYQPFTITMDAAQRATMHKFLHPDDASTPARPQPCSWPVEGNPRSSMCSRTDTDQYWLVASMDGSTHKHDVWSCQRHLIPSYLQLMYDHMDGYARQITTHVVSS